MFLRENLQCSLLLFFFSFFSLAISISRGWKGVLVGELEFWGDFFLE